MLDILDSHNTLVWKPPGDLTWATVYNLAFSGGPRVRLGSMESGRGVLGISAVWGCLAFRVRSPYLPELRIAFCKVRKTCFDKCFQSNRFPDRMRRLVAGSRGWSASNPSKRTPPPEHLWSQSRQLGTCRLESLWKLSAHPFSSLLIYLPALLRPKPGEIMSLLPLLLLHLSPQKSSKITVTLKVLDNGSDRSPAFSAFSQFSNEPVWTENGRDRSGVARLRQSGSYLPRMALRWCGCRRLSCSEHGQRLHSREDGGACHHVFFG